MPIHGLALSQGLQTAGTALPRRAQSQKLELPPASQPDSTQRRSNAVVGTREPQIEQSKLCSVPTGLDTRRIGIVSRRRPLRRSDSLPVSSAISPDWSACLPAYATESVFRERVRLSDGDLCRSCCNCSGWRVLLARRSPPPHAVSQSTNVRRRPWDHCRSARSDFQQPRLLRDHNASIVERY